MCFLVNVYAPQDRHKRKAWDFIISFMNNHMVNSSFLAIRSHEERYGMEYCKRTTYDFNNFIIDADLFDVPMGGW